MALSEYSYSDEVTRMRVPHRRVGLTGKDQDTFLSTGKIERSAEALRIEK
jgi:hypothetical protein